MNTEILDNEIENLYEQSLQNMQTIKPYFVNGDTNQEIRVDKYSNNNGTGFVIMAKLKDGSKTYIRSKNYGPLSIAETEWKEIFNYK